MNVRFDCPACEGATARSNLPGPETWRCPACEHVVRLTEPSVVPSPEGPTLQSCAVCGGAELYKKKDFPHWLGVAILAAACVAFLVLHGWYEPWLAWTVLIGSALLDGALYLAVKDVVVCYNCGAEYRGLGRSGNKPFELTVHERYRQQKMRKQQLGQKG